MLMHTMNSRRIGFLAVAVVLMMLLVGCERTRISDINKDPGRYYNKQVTIAGQVTSAFGALNQGAFELDDGTGRLWVVSSGFGVPSQGARVAVTGFVQSGITVAGRSFANVLRESKPRDEGD
jgi:X-X-X-Leu-X-X-Gly heptad repeat protein